MNIIDTITDIIEGIKALPACAEAVREMSSHQRKVDKEFWTECQRRLALLEAKLPAAVAERDLLQRKLDYLLRPRKQSEEPCPFPDRTWVFYHDGDELWCAQESQDLNHNELWRPVDLTHFEE